MWKKSSFSGGAGMCVEVFRKSTFSEINGSCVEVSRDGEMTAVRDTKDLEGGPTLYFTEDEWQAFIKGVKAGEFD
jgi:hypothetical protein